MKHSIVLVVALGVSAAAGLGCEKKNPSAPAAAKDGGGAAASAPAAKTKPAEASKPAAAAAPAPAAAPAETKTKVADTGPLWAFAPANATFGFVVGDGVGIRTLNLFHHQLKKLEGKPFAKKALAQLDAWRKEQPVDFLDEAAIKAKGFDPAKGLAVFGSADTSKPALLVLPVGDLAAFRTTMKAKTEKVGDREVDKMEDVVCTTVASRYACAPTLEAVDAAMKPHDSPLAAAVKALPADSRGDVEGYVDVAKTPEIAQGLADLKPMGELTTIGGALRVDLTGMNLQMWAKGTMSPIVAALASAAPPADLANMTANATTVLRAKVDPKLLLANVPPTMPVGNIDVRKDLLDKLTGDIQLVTAGKGIMAGAVMLKVTDTASVKKVIGAICAEAKKGGELPVSAVVATEDTCSGEISLAKLKDAIGVELPPFKFNFSVPGNVFVMAFGDLDPASLKGTAADVAGSPETREALAGAQTFVFWSRDLGVDFSALPKDLADKALSNPEVAEGLALMNWAGAQVYDISLAGNISATGVKVNLHSNSFEADPADAKAAYFAAVDKRLAGDRAGYLAAMADIEKKFPNTLAARRAALERTGSPIVGPVAGIMAGAGAATFMLQAGAAMSKTAPGFGEPQAPTPAAPAAPAAPAPAPAPSPAAP